MAGSEYHLGAVQAQCMDADLNLAFPGGGISTSSSRRTSAPPIS
jgi:hypothetical protein